MLNLKKLLTKILSAMTNPLAVRTFTYDSLNIEIYVYPAKLRVARVYSTQSITQSAVGWTNVGAYADGLATCTILADSGLRVGLRANNGQLQILIPSQISGWFVGATATVI